MIDFSWHKTVTLKSGKQVELRYPRLEDVSPLMDFFNIIVDEDTYLMANKKVTLEEEQEYLQKILDDMRQQKAIKILAVDGSKIIGAIDGIQLRMRMSHITSLGISISKEYRGDGLGSLLIGELFSQAPQHLGAKQMTLVCAAENTPALNLYKKMNFVEYGRLPQALLYKGEYLDQVKMYRTL